MRSTPRNPGSNETASHEAERIVPGTRLWDELYPEHIQRYEFTALRMAPGAGVLDAGCGSGHGAAYLLDRGAGAVVAVDLSAEAIQTARTHFDRPGITWVQEDCHTLEEAGKHGPFDLVCNLENLEHLADPDRFLGRVTELLRPEGVLITSSPNRIGVNRLRGVNADAPTSNPFHFREYTVGEFHALLSRYFERVTLSYQTLVPLERMVVEPALSALWHNPAMRFGRWLQRVIRRRPMIERLEDLLPPRRYAILAEDPGAMLVITHLAECRGPRRTRV